MTMDAPGLDGSSLATPARGARTLVVSSVRLLRDGLAIALSHNGTLDVVGVSEATLDAVLSAMGSSGTQRPEVVLLDFGRPEAVDLARQLAERVPDVTMVALAVSDAEADVRAYAAAGIRGFVPSGGSIDDVIATVAHAVRGEVLCSPRLAASMLRGLLATGGVPSPPPDAEVLTRREREIVALVDQGLSNKEIGSRLQIGTATVKNHVHHILEKLEVPRRGQAAARLR